MMSPVMSSITGMSDLVPESKLVSTPHVVELTPDASVLDAVGRGHTLASAFADLIDNSLDAGAEHVNIRFVTTNSTIRSIRISDDGSGMTAAQLETAMSIGRGREHRGDALGHFGVGLKGASFSQAHVLTVYSASGHSPVAAMRMARGQAGARIVAESFDSETAAALLRRRGFPGDSGTLVEWTRLESVSVAVAVQERRRWIESMILQVRDELGLIFHRMLANSHIRISLDEMDETSGETGAPRLVKPIDPFAFDRWGAAGYPRRITAHLATGKSLVADCYILPTGVATAAAKPLGRSRSESQGLYVYRNDRLLQAGGWLGLRADDPTDLQLGRIILEIGDETLDAVRINPEKRGVVLRPDAVQALESAVSDGLTVRGFWQDARNVWTESRRRSTAPQPAAALGEGAPSGLRNLIEQTVGVDETGVGVSFVWSAMPEGQLFAFEPGTGIVRMNEHHRAALERTPSQLDFVKTSLFVLLEPHAGKERLGPSTIERVNLMQAALAASLDIQDAEPSAEVDHPASNVVGETSSVASPRPGHRYVVHDAVVSNSEDYEPLADVHVAHVHVSAEALDDFIRATRRTALLSAEEEVELARRIEVGLFAGERLRTHFKGLPADQDALDLLWLEREGREAMARMVASNIRLVISIAKHHQWNGLDLADLVQEGNAGLLRAIQKFDFHQGTKFSTYATWWIRQSIVRAIADQGRLIRFPVHVTDKLPKLRAAWEEATGGATQRIVRAARSADESVAFMRSVIHNLRPHLSLDGLVPVMLDTGAWLDVPRGEAIVDSEPQDAYDATVVTMFRVQLMEVVDSLNAREAAVIRMRFGLDDGCAMTLDQIGDAFGVTRERIRQIEKKALQNLRHPTRSGILRDFWWDQDPDRWRAETEEVVDEPAAEALGAAGAGATPDPTADQQIEAMVGNEMQDGDASVGRDGTFSLLDLYANGWSVEEMAVAFGLEVEEVVRALHRWVFGGDLSVDEVRSVLQSPARPPVTRRMITRFRAEARSATAGRASD